MSQYTYFVKKIYQPNENSVVLEMGNAHGAPVFDFKPGQYVMIAYKNEKGEIEDQHAFSIASSPTQKDTISLGIRLGGNFTKGLLKLREGDPVFVNGPFGDFVFDEKKYADTVMIAGGIGITPFYSAMKYATDKNLPNKILLLYGARTLAGTTFMPEIRALSEQNSNLSCLFAISNEMTPVVVDDTVFESMNVDILKKQIGSVEGKTFLLCGPVPFMEAMRKALLKIGVLPKQIKSEHFIMIPDTGVVAVLKNLMYALGFTILVCALVFYFLTRSVAASVSDTETNNNETTLARLKKINEVAKLRMRQIIDAKMNAINALSTQPAKAEQSKALSVPTSNRGTSTVNTTSVPARTTVS